MGEKERSRGCKDGEDKSKASERRRRRGEGVVRRVGGGGGEAQYRLCLGAKLSAIALSVLPSLDPPSPSHSPCTRITLLVALAPPC